MALEYLLSMCSLSQECMQVAAPGVGVGNRSQSGEEDPGNLSGSSCRFGIEVAPRMDPEDCPLDRSKLTHDTSSGFSVLLLVVS